MKAIRINGQDSTINTAGIQKITDLVELVKTVIDPAHIITTLLIDGRELEEHEWTAPISQFDNSVIEIETGDPEEYVFKRIAAAPDIISNCFIGFRSARKDFQAGQMQSANRKLLSAVNTLREFFSWYATLLELLDVSKRPAFDITTQVRELTETCKGICQQQLYQSWWAIGETLEKELEPQLDKLEDHCRKVTKDIPQYQS